MPEHSPSRRPARPSLQLLAGGITKNWQRSPGRLHREGFSRGQDVERVLREPVQLEFPFVQDLPKVLPASAFRPGEIAWEWFKRVFNDPSRDAGKGREHAAFYVQALKHQEWEEEQRSSFYRSPEGRAYLAEEARLYRETGQEAYEAEQAREEILAKLGVLRPAPNPPSGPFAAEDPRVLERRRMHAREHAQRELGDYFFDTVWEPNDPERWARWLGGDLRRRLDRSTGRVPPRAPRDLAAFIREAEEAPASGARAEEEPELPEPA